MEIKGRLFAILEEQSGTTAKGTWKKQEFILETIEQFPRKVCISLWGEKTEFLRHFAIGDEINVYINLESREYNQRWFTDVRAWKIDKESGQTTVSTPSVQNQTQEVADGSKGDFNPTTEDLPF